MTGENKQTKSLWLVSVNLPGDVNGDGLSDVIVGAIRYTGLTGGHTFFMADKL